VMPGALLIESLAQAGTALLEVSSKFKSKALLVIIEQAKFRSIVKPGDQLLIQAKVISSYKSAAKMDGKILVKDRMVMNAAITFSLKDAEEFYPPKTRHLMESVYDNWLQGAEIIESSNETEN
jgi:3-hydroxyacyl-[acyl-carrier-protein] dehydratase